MLEGNKLYRELLEVVERYQDAGIGFVRATLRDVDEYISILSNKLPVSVLVAGKNPADDEASTGSKNQS